MNLGLIPSLFLFFGVLSLIYSAALHQYHNARYQKVIQHWSLGTFLWGISILMTIFRTEIPLLLSYFFANALAYVANVELNRGLKRLARDDQTSHDKRWLDVLYLLAFMGALLTIDALTPAEYREAAKTTFVSASIVVVSILGARHCFEFGRKHTLTLAVIFGYIYLVVALLWSIRIVAALARLGSYAFDATPINTVVFVLIFITGVLRYLIFPLVLLQKTENDKQAQLKQSLVKASKTATAGALSASIAHELNQPLTAMRIKGQLLRKRITDPRAGHKPEDLLSTVDDILAENERAAKIITSLRAIFSQSQPTKAEVDLTQLIHKTIALVQKEMARQGIRFELSLAAGLRINIAEDEFHQVLLNLLLNSSHALQNHDGATDKTIAISSLSQGRLVKLVVSDNGPGVLQDMEPSLFDLLSTSKDTGMGVGLWLSKYIVERHGGTMAYAPAALGGACFTITLPACSDQSQELPVHALSASLP